MPNDSAQISRAAFDCSLCHAGEQARRIEVVGEDAAWLAAEFQAIGDDPEKFKAFVNAAGAGC